MKHISILLICLLLLQLCACGKTQTPETTAAVTTAQAEPLQTEAETEPPETEPAVMEVMERTIRRDGVTWRYNSRLRTVLFMGIDTKADVVSREVLGNGGRADVILLFVLDPDARTTQLVEISRDTIATVDVYNEQQQKLHSGKMQINMQYAFGNNPARSCHLMKNRIVKLLYELPIDYYCSMTMDGIAAAVDSVGGVTMTLDEDWTSIDPSYTAGATITFNGAQAERFVRYRDVEDVQSNAVRMARHGWIINELFQQLRDSGELDLVTIFRKMAPYLESDMDAETLAMLSAFDLLPDVLQLPGEVRAGKYHAEYHLDEPALQQMLLELFYDPVD